MYEKLLPADTVWSAAQKLVVKKSGRRCSQINKAFGLNFHLLVCRVRVVTCNQCTPTNLNAKVKLPVSLIYF